MKSVVALLALTSGISLAAPSSANDPIPRSLVFGRDYIRLVDWASRNDLAGRWLVRNESASFTNRSSRLTFRTDSNKAEINGITVMLNWPVARKDATLYLSQQDLQSVVTPIIVPPRNRPGERVMTICLDPGHGGRDPGNLDGRQQEKKYTLLLGLELASQLKQLGFKVVMTRTDDSYPELPARPDLAKSSRADLFLSLHFNSFRSPEIKGTQVYCMTPRGAISSQARGEAMSVYSFPGNANDDKNILLAYQVQKSLVRDVRAEDRGVQHARWAVLRDARMPAILIEAGYMSNPSDARKIYDATYRRQMAQAIAAGLVAYKKIVER